MQITESSPEHKVSLPEIPSDSQNYDHYIEETTSSSDCPDELYNLTKLAEVSLAAASGQLYHHRHLSAAPFAPSPVQVQKSLTTETGYAHKLFDRDRDRVNVVRSEACKPLGKTKDGASGAVGDNLGEGAQHECPDCGKRYSTSSNLARHRQTHRSLADKKARRCPHCDKVMSRVFCLHSVNFIVCLFVVEGLCFDACVFNAREDARAGLSLPLLREMLLAALVATRTY